MHAMTGILGFVGGLWIQAGLLGLFASYQDLMRHVWGIVFGAVDYPVWLLRGAAQQLLGWEFLCASAAGLGLGFLVVRCFKKVGEELSRLFLSWQ